MPIRRAYCLGQIQKPTSPTHIGLLVGFGRAPCDFGSTVVVVTLRPILLKNILLLKIFYHNSLIYPLDFLGLCFFYNIQVCGVIFLTSKIPKNSFAFLNKCALPPSPTRGT